MSRARWRVEMAGGRASVLHHALRVEKYPSVLFETIPQPNDGHQSL